MTEKVERVPNESFEASQLTVPRLNPAFLTTGNTVCKDYFNALQREMYEWAVRMWKDDPKFQFANIPMGFISLHHTTFKSLQELAARPKTNSGLIPDNFRLLLNFANFLTEFHTQYTAEHAEQFAQPQERLGQNFLSLPISKSPVEWGIEFWKNKVLP